MVFNSGSIHKHHFSNTKFLPLDTENWTKASSVKLKTALVLPSKCDLEEVEDSPDKSPLVLEMQYVSRVRGSGQEEQHLKEPLDIVVRIRQLKIRQSIWK